VLELDEDLFRVRSQGCPEASGEAFGW